MKIIGIVILDKKGEIRSEAFDLSGFGYFQRSLVKEFVVFFSKLVANRVGINEKNRLKYNDYVIYCYRNEKYTYCVISDQDYPAKVAFNAVDEIVTENNSKPVSNKELELIISKYKDPEKITKIEKIQSDLDEIRVVLNTTIDNLLTRGEKLEDLVEKSQTLSAQSKEFYKVSRQQNGCWAFIRSLF